MCWALYIHSGRVSLIWSQNQCMASRRKVASHATVRFSVTKSRVDIAVLGCRSVIRFVFANISNTFDDHYPTSLFMPICMNPQSMATKLLCNSQSCAFAQLHFTAILYGETGQLQAGINNHSTKSIHTDRITKMRLHRVRLPTEKIFPNTGCTTAF